MSGRAILGGVVMLGTGLAVGANDWSLGVDLGVILLGVLLFGLVATEPRPGARARAKHRAILAHELHGYANRLLEDHDGNFESEISFGHLAYELEAAAQELSLAAREVYR